MKKKILVCALIGAPIGLLISDIVTVIISLATGNGEYYPVAHELMADCKSEISAVIMQLICSLVFGAVWGGASVIWKMEDWSYLKMTLIHLIICCITTLPIALLLHWIPTYTLVGMILYFGLFFGIYFVIWASYYFSMKAKVRKMNERIKESKSSADSGSF